MTPSDRKKTAKRRAMEKEMSLSRRVVGHLSDNVNMKRDALRNWALAPEDTRDLTGRIFGDPVPGDPRCPWRPGVVA